MDDSRPMAPPPRPTRLTLAVIGWLLSASLGACGSNDNAAKYIAAGAIAPSVPSAGSAGIAGNGSAGIAGSAGNAVTAAGAGMPAGGAAASGSARFSDVLAIFTTHKCMSCHAGSNGLVINPAAAPTTHMALLGPSQSTGMCSGKVYVVAGKPMDSFLYDKLANSPPKCGSRMPVSSPALSDAELATVHSWISAGALND